MTHYKSGKTAEQKIFSPWFLSLKINVLRTRKLTFSLKTRKRILKIIIHQTYFPEELPVRYELPTYHSKSYHSER